MPGILAGVDGSDHSRRALEWAMREAAHDHVPLTVMTARPAPAHPATELFWGLPELPEDSGDLELARTRLQQFADKVATEISVTVPKLTVSVVPDMWPKNSSRPPMTPTCLSWDPAVTAGSLGS